MSMFSNLRGLGAGKKPADGEMPPSPGDNADGYDGEMSRADLLAQIQVLLDKNTRFETRFRDVVAAYKSLLKENDALKSTVSALTGGDNRAPAGENGPSNAASTEPHATATAAEAADGGESSAEDGSSQAPPPEASEPAPATADLQRQLTALKTAVRTITEEKANITSQFQRDKKTVAEAQRAALAKQRRAHEESEAKLKQLLNQQEEEKVLLQGQVEALTQQVLDGHAASREAEAAWEKQRAALREEMAEAVRQRRDAEQVHEEVQQLETKLQAARDAELEALTQLNSTSGELRSQCAELEEELSRAKSALAAEQSRGESEVVLQLKKDLRSAQKKAQLSNEALEVAVAERDTAIREAKRRVEQTEAQLAAHARQEEDRDSVEARSRILQETRLSEMSALVGRYEASRLEDSRTIKHLRDEVFDLTEELRHARSRTPSVSDAGSSQGGESNAALLDKVAKLKSLLYLSNQRVVEQSSSTNAVRQGDPGSRGPSVIDVPPPSTHAVVAADDLSPDLLRAHEEITEYYNRAKTLLEANNELQRRNAILSRQRDQLETANKTATSSSETALAQACERWEAEKDSLRAQLERQAADLKKAHRDELESLQKRNQRTRERTIALLADRDAELDRLRKASGLAARAGELVTAVDMEATPSPNGSPPSRRHSRANGGGGPLRSGTMTDNMSVGGPLVHLAKMEKARAQERAEAREKIQGLESQLQEAAERLSLSTEQCAALKEEIRRLERNARREGANLEYLKNIVLRYLETSVGRDRTLHAIATILEFSPEEVKRISKKEASWFGGAF